MQYNLQAVEKTIEQLLDCMGIDKNREGLQDTPVRVAKYWQELLQGEQYTNDDIAEMYGKCFECTDRDIVIERDISIFSHCEHHLALMYDMSVTVAYIPHGEVIGLSKIARIADMVARRLQLQERITSDIHYILSKVLNTENVLVIVQGKHACMTARGIKNVNAITRTMKATGELKNYRLDRIIKG